MDKAQKSKTISLADYGITDATINFQLTPDELHKITVDKRQGVTANNGALAINTGELTGRSPKDRFI